MASERRIYCSPEILHGLRQLEAEVPDGSVNAIELVQALVDSGLIDDELLNGFHRHLARCMIQAGLVVPRDVAGEVEAGLAKFLDEGEG